MIFRFSYLKLVTLPCDGIASQYGEIEIKLNVHGTFIVFPGENIQFIYVDVITITERERDNTGLVILKFSSTPIA